MLGPRPFADEIAAVRAALRPSPRSAMAGLPWSPASGREGHSSRICPRRGRPRPAPTPTDRGAVRLYQTTLARCPLARAADPGPDRETRHRGTISRPDPRPATGWAPTRTPSRTRRIFTVTLLGRRRQLERAVTRGGAPRPRCPCCRRRASIPSCASCVDSLAAEGGDPNIILTSRACRDAQGASSLLLSAVRKGAVEHRTKELARLAWPSSNHCAY